MKRLFERYFRRELINEDDSLAEEMQGNLDDAPAANADTQGLMDEMDDSLEDTNQALSDAEDAHDVLRSKIEEKIKKGNDQIATWAQTLEEFATFINDPSNEQSIKHIIDNAGSGTALASIKDTAGKMMIKVATDCVILAQTLRGRIGSVTVDDVMKLSK